MINPIELQVISRILTSESADEVETLCSYDSSYYDVFSKHIQFILNHKLKYGKVPDTFTFLAQFADDGTQLVRVDETTNYLTTELIKNKKQIMFREMFNKFKDIDSGTIDAVWDYVGKTVEEVNKLSTSKPLDLIHDADLRAKQVQEFSKQARIPTGFPEIDHLMYGGLSTVEELLLILARTNTGKSWVCVKMMESAQSKGFPVLYYSPEMQGAFLGTRFDSWRKHFRNKELVQGKYSDEYLSYLQELPTEGASAFILEDKDVASGIVNVPVLENIVQKEKIKLLIVDGLSYLEDYRGAKGETDVVRFKNICNDLFRLSKKYGCAVVVAVQANRETKDMKDDKGVPFPNMYNIEGSDHPARIATQVFSLRQVFSSDPTRVMDIRLEKSRNAANQNPILSYAWDPDVGRVQYLPAGASANAPTTSTTPTVNISGMIQTTNFGGEEEAFDDTAFEDSDLEF